ncbi:5661cfff-505e-45af-b21b-b57b5ea29c0d [Sclerotinia trifoliorum]|uniref:5661cfff-505e-45af-b21b-b57b5ea29c0d n=1 Tax=Sclerotinia trifoliorum TaxID=28548 RepID=A0A8H2VMP9_9HELO|nr:5661cfff-505e-45af-b21b-b57b5ea29c0d [Sclerotinia trifoliorum]
MTPPIPTFPPSSLPYEARFAANASYRKDFDGNLENCELIKFYQYSCDLEKDKDGKFGKKIACQPVKRLFRRCKDRKGIFMVETTVWEGEGSAK